MHEYCQWRLVGSKTGAVVGESTAILPLPPSRATEEVDASTSNKRNLVMMARYIALYAVTLLGVVAMQSTSAQALSIAECSAKYKAAKAAGTLNGMKWNDFRKAQCGAEATAAPAPAAAQPTTPTAALKPAPTPMAAPVSVGNAVFPNAVSPKYSGQSAGKARMETCLDQYRANKANNANGGLKWIQRGGGYYSECIKHLKGQA